ncbi:MAG: F0F1 ATP synthase subunit gamma [Chloroflexota bacterium]|nr:F0F1 ATP synthase subunit gamma [Chloroflexota bacterium]
MEEVERARERLENIGSVKPILGGLRTISLGSWQAALKRRSSVRSYSEHLRAMLPWLVPHLQNEQGMLTRLRQAARVASTLSDRGAGQSRTGSRPPELKALVVGSERGLCGRFNVAVAEEADRYLRRESARGSNIELMVLGRRAQRVLRRRGYEPTEAGTLSMTSLPPLSLGFDLTRRWLTAYEEEKLDGVDVIYNGYRGTGAYEPTVIRLIPPQLATGEAGLAEEAGEPGARGEETRISGERRQPWPPPIVDTDPLSLYATVVEQSVAVQLYKVLLDSSAAEHSTRFQLMESATQNADRLIEELTLVIQTARRHEITQEMQELAAGAGLLGRE